IIETTPDENGLTIAVGEEVGLEVECKLGADRAHRGMNERKHTRQRNGTARRRRPGRQSHLAGISKSGGRRFGLKQQTRSVERILVAMLSLVDNMDEQFQVREYKIFFFDFANDPALFRSEPGGNAGATVTNGRATRS